MKNPFSRGKSPIQMGENARRIIEDPLYAESFDQVDAIIIKLLKETTINSESDKDYVIKLVLRLQATAGAKKWLDTQMQIGRLYAEQEQAKELQKKSFLNPRGL